MRIALFTETFLPKIDGISHTLCRLLEHLEAGGHESLLLGPAGGPDRYAGTPIVGLPAGAFPPYRELRLVPPIFDPGDRVAAFAPDLVHVVNPVSLGVTGIRIARRMDLPLVASYHTDIPGFATRWGYGVLAGPLWRYLRWLHNRADLNLCPSRYTRQQLERNGFRRLRVWARGVDTARFGPHWRDRGWRARLSGGRDERTILLYVGRLSPEKRLDWLRPVLDAVPEARLSIVGDGPARSALEQAFAGTGTVFTGFLSGEDLSRAYASADLFVFPAANETFGNVVLEAMASGLPVVAPASGGVLDSVVDGETGLLFSPEDKVGLVRCAGRLALSPATARRLGGSGRKVAESRSWDRVFDGLLADYREVIDARRLLAQGDAA